MFLPILYLIGSPVPKADVYHTTATGYGGLLGALGSWKYNKPLIVTEHGIYTREREEELLRAKWVSPHFRQHWIDMFYMLPSAPMSGLPALPPSSVGIPRSRENWVLPLKSAASSATASGWTGSPFLRATQPSVQGTRRQRLLPLLPSRHQNSP